MSPQINDRRAGQVRHSFEPKPIQELAVKFELESAHKAIPAFRQLPMSLRGDGEYVMKVDGDTLHVFETSGVGIKKFDFTDRTKGGDFEIQDGVILVSFKAGNRIEKIALHTAPAQSSVSAIDAHFLPLQNELIEAKRIKSKGDDQTAGDKKRLADIIRAVQARAQEPRKNIPVPESESSQREKELAGTQEELEKSQRKVSRLEAELRKTKDELDARPARNNQYNYRPSSSG